MDTLKRVFSLKRTKSARNNKPQGSLRYKNPPMPTAGSTESINVQIANYAPIGAQPMGKSPLGHGNKPAPPPARPAHNFASPTAHNAIRPSQSCRTNVNTPSPIAARGSLMSRPAPSPPTRPAYPSARPGQPSGLRPDELKPTAPPRPNAGPRLSEETVRKKMDAISESIDHTDLAMGRAFRDLRKLGLMDGNPAHRQHDMLQINYEKKLRATLETLLSLAKEKDQMIETIGKGGVVEEQLVAYIELLWRQKISHMSHFSDMGNYEACAIDPQLVRLTADVLARTKVE